MHTLVADPERSGGHMISMDDAEYPREYRTLGSGPRRFSNVGLVHTSERRHTVVAAQSLEALSGLPKVDAERRRDALMDHIKSKYPAQHAASPSPSHGAPRGSTERPREQQQQQPNYWSFKSRSPRHSQSTQVGLADQATKLSFASAESLETMSEADIPLGFNRMNRFRQSLPLSRSASQTKLRTPGVLFLQYGDETRRVHITHELSSLDTLHALIAHMFPQKLTVGMLKSPGTAILIKDEARNVFYELEDVRDIQDRSVIKIYRKEPIYASYPAAHLANGDLRVSKREMVYTSRESSPTRRLNHLPSSSSPPSGSPSRSRLSYSGGRPPSFTGPAHSQPHPHPHHPLAAHPHHPPAAHPQAGLSPSPSAILERRDVKPDEEVSGKSMVLLKNEGLYADPYGLVHEGRLSIASTQSLAALGEPFAFPVPGGLYRRGSVRSLSTYSAAALQGELEEALYKPGGPLYHDSYATSATLGMGFRMPPSSPQKIPDAQVRDRDSYSGSPSRGSPVRQGLRKDSASSSVFVESPKSRSGSGSDALCGALVPAGEVARGTSGFSSSLPGNEAETRERMEAMEKQIASLTGLVQSVLTRGPDSDSTEKTESTSDCSGTGTGRLKKRKALTPSAPLALMPPPPTIAAQATTVTRLQMQLHLHDLQLNATELRDQLSQLRKMQLQNQDSVRSLLKRTETEISARMTDALRKQEDPLQRQRLLVEEERLKYLNEEELIIQQLHDLEKSVEEIQKDSSVNHKLVTMQELEEKAGVLRKLGETLTELKNQFPSLQSKMRVVLRVEVEAVKFLKEEPQRLDALLKRCKNVTDTLTMLRRQANEGIWKTPEDFASPSPKHASDFRKTADFDVPTSPPLNLNGLGSNSLSNWVPHSGSVATHNNPIGSHHDPHTSASLKNRALEELSGRRGADKSVSVEAAERDWEEKRASLTQYSAQDINRLLEETQAELMKAIPDLDFAAKQINKPSAPPASQSVSATPEHRPSKPQHAPQKLSSKEASPCRGSDELTVPRYRTEKPSKSPPPPPPRRSFPSSHGLTTNRTGEVIVTSKTLKKAESDEAEVQKPLVKLRRVASEAPRPASTPPIIAASGVKDENDEEKIIAELEVFQRTPIKVKVSPPHSLPNTLRRTRVPPSSLDLSSSVDLRRKLSVASMDCSGLQWEMGRLYQRPTSTSAPALEEMDAAPCSSSSNQIPQILFSEWSPVPPRFSERSVSTQEQDRHKVCQVELEKMAGGIRGSIASPYQVSTLPIGRIANRDQTQSLTQSRESVVVTQSSEEVPQRRTKPQPWELRIQESFEETEVEESIEDLALLLTQQELRVLSETEAQAFTEQHGQRLQTLTLPLQSQTISEVNSREKVVCRPQLSSTPLVLFFRERMQVKEAYRHLETLLEEDDSTLGNIRAGGEAGPLTVPGKPMPKPRLVRTMDTNKGDALPRIRIPRDQLFALKAALNFGIQTGERTLKLCFNPEKDPCRSPSETDGARHKTNTGVCKSKSVGLVSLQQYSLSGNQPREDQVRELRSTTYRGLNSLEETIRELESAIQEISSQPSMGHLLRKLTVPTEDTKEPGKLKMHTGHVEQSAGIDDSDCLIVRKKPPVPPKPFDIPPQMTKVLFLSLQWPVIGTIFLT
ncbi:SRC kinase signaling inhibitor 1-like isoform X4 [Scleropages formosus]|uniref:SRC kinase signaling inhibitor 1-like isoform X4 n=1 Tax=Scleropages formosus TaxID=113540 RepID=UPI0010FABEF9|nr:SRC kinase signaling inhibitor 1-like isoform X4 [Scleropages formosus]